VETGARHIILLELNHSEIEMYGLGERALVRMDCLHCYSYEHLLNFSCTVWIRPRPIGLKLGWNGSGSRSRSLRQYSLLTSRFGCRRTIYQLSDEWLRKRARDISTRPSLEAELPLDHGGTQG
jgi:hypothetical protein